MNSITCQSEIHPVLPTVFGAKDYREFRETLEETNHILTATGIIRRLTTQKILEGNSHLSIQRQQSLYLRYRQSLRYCILLGITGHSYRSLSLRVVASQLFQWFTYTFMSRLAAFYRK